MCLRRNLGYIFLVWFPGVLHAQSPTQPCSAPRLNGGYFVPEQDAYSHETKLNYACDNGHKPVVDGWWATSTCQNGTWSPEPQCIDEKACVSPTIPNAVYTVSTNGWYEERDTIRITCDKGYEHRDWDATAQCINGMWSSVPVCEKSADSCGAPPQILHAVVINQEYQELFPVDTKVQYECEDGYTVEGADSKKYTYCIAGKWTEGPTCSRGTRPGTGHGGPAVEGTGGRDTTSAGSGTQPAGGGSRPGTGHGGSAGGGHTTSTSGGTQPAGGGSRPGTGHGGSAGGGHTTSTSGGTRPVGGGSSEEAERQITTINSCGTRPVVPNGDVVRVDLTVLRYQCANFYKRVGPEEVRCYSDGTWSEIPICKAAYCVLDTDQYPQLISAGVKYIKDGEKVRLDCVQLTTWWTHHYAVGRCNHGRMLLSRCCDWWDLNTNVC